MPVTSRVERALQKYEQRGWFIVTNSVDGACRAWERHCEDNFTWKIERRPNTLFTQTDPAQLGSWYMKALDEDDIDAHIVTFGVLSGRGLQFSYVVTDLDFEHEMNERFRWNYNALWNLHHGDGQCLGYVFMNLCAPISFSRHYLGLTPTTVQRKRTMRSSRSSAQTRLW